jgi:hypothetical protein
MIGEYLGMVWKKSVVAQYFCTGAGGNTKTSVRIHDVPPRLEPSAPKYGCTAYRYVNVFDFWDVTPRSLADRYQRFDGSCFLSAFGPFSRFWDVTLNDAFCIATTWRRMTG